MGLGVGDEAEVEVEVGVGESEPTKVTSWTKTSKPPTRCDKKMENVENKTSKNHLQSIKSLAYKSRTMSLLLLSRESRKIVH